MLAEIPIHQSTAAIDQVAADALWEAAIDQPPVDAFRLAQRLGISVTQNDQLPHRAQRVRFSLESPRATQAIVIGPEDRPERRHWAVAHEVGEAIAQRVFDTLGADPCDASPGSREQVANALAGRLLAPSRWLLGLFRDSQGDLAQLKQCFSTASHELIVRRLLESHRDPLIVTVFDHGRLTWRRWNLGGLAPPLNPRELVAWESAHKTGESAWETLDSAQAESFSSEEQAATAWVRAWPVHEPGWKREVLLTQLREGAMETEYG